MAVPTVSFWVHLESTSYEDEDGIRVWVDCADDSTMDLLAGVLDDAAHPSSDLDNPDSQLVEDVWVQHTADLGACGTATLSFGVQSNSGSEEAWFDYFEFYSA